MATNKTAPAAEVLVAADATTEPRVSVIPKGFDPMRVYTSMDLDEAGVKLATLDINRDINERSVLAKIASIKETGIIICPSIIVSARACLDQGLSLKLDGVAVTESTPDLDSIVVLADGVHRKVAWDRHSKDTEYKGKKPYNIFVVPSGEVDIAVMLKEANISTSPWRSTDYLKALIHSKRAKKVDVEMLEWIYAHYKDGSESSIWHWVTLSSLPAPSKKKLNNAMGDETKFTELVATLNRYTLGKSLYEEFCGKIDKSIAGLRVVPKLIAEWVEIDINKSIPLDKAVERGKAFIASIDAANAENLKGFKSDPILGSRQQRIRELLVKLHDEFVSKLEATA